MRKTFLLILLLFVILFPCCKKKTCNETESSVVAGTSEISTIENYLTANSINATKHSSGLFYTIINQGSGDYPDLCSSITVKYKGTLLSGTVFDQSSANVSFQLKNLIIGWQKGIPLIQKGGEIILYVPPSLGYGSSAQSGIPANSTLVFDINLIGVVK